MKIVMEKNRTHREIREALRDAYEQVAEAAADALMFDFEAENLEVEDYLAFDRDGVWGLDWSLFDEDDFKRWEKELRKTLIKSDWRDEDIEEAATLFDVLKVEERTERKVVEAITRDRVLLAKVEAFIDDKLDEAASGGLLVIRLDSTRPWRRPRRPCAIGLSLSGFGGGAFSDARSPSMRLTRK